MKNLFKKTKEVLEIIKKRGFGKEFLVNEDAAECQEEPNEKLSDKEEPKEVPEISSVITYEDFKDVPAFLKTAYQLKQMGLTPSKKVIGRINYKDEDLDLFHVFEAVPNLKYAACKESYKGQNFSCSPWKLPNVLKTEDQLEKMGLEATGDAVAKVSYNGKEQSVFYTYETKPLIKAERMLWAKLKPDYTPIKAAKGVSLKEWECIEKDWVNNPEQYVILDTETTGLGSFAEIIQIAIIGLDGSVLINEKFEPEKEFEEEALKVHGITKDDLKGVGKWTDKWESIQEILKTKKILIHNASYDLRLIEQTCLRYGIEITFTIDAMCIMGYCRKKYGVQKLSKVLDHLEIVYKGDNLHDAEVDCQMCLAYINHALDKLKVTEQRVEVQEELINEELVAEDPVTEDPVTEEVIQQEVDSVQEIEGVLVDEEKSLSELQKEAWSRFISFCICKERIENTNMYKSFAGVIEKKYAISIENKFADTTAEMCKEIITVCTNEINRMLNIC